MAGLTNAEKVAAIAAGTNPSANNNTTKLPEKKTTSSTTRRNTTTAPASTGTAPLTNAEKAASIAAGTNPSAGVTTAAGSPLNQSRDAQVRQSWAARPTTEKFAPATATTGQTRKVPQATVTQRLNALGSRISQNEKQLTNMGLQLNRLETAYNRGDYSAVDQYNALADRYNKAFEQYTADIGAYNQLYRSTYRDQSVRDSYARRQYMEQRQAARDQGSRQLYQQRLQEEALRAPITTTIGKENERVVTREPNRFERVVGAGLSGTASGFTTAAGLVLNNQIDEHDSRTLRRKGASVGEHSYKRISGEEPREAGYTYAVSPAYQQRMARAKLTADGLIDTGRRLNNRSTLQTDIAKEGLGETGQMLVDLGVMAVQMAADIGIAAATGGSMLVPLGIRSYGNGYLTAEQMGFTGDAANSYALGVAGVEVLSEVMFSVFGIVNKFAKGVITQELSERVIDGLVKRLATSTGGRTALNRLFTILFSAGSEGLEEVVAGVLEPVIRKITLDRDVKVLKEIDWQETLYEGLLGGILGGLGGAVDLTNTRPTYWKYYKQGINEGIERYEEAVKKNGLESREALQAAKEVWDGGTRKMNEVAGWDPEGRPVTYHQLAALEAARAYGRQNGEQGPSLADSLNPESLGRYLENEEKIRRQEAARREEAARLEAEEKARVDAEKTAQSARDVGTSAQGELTETSRGITPNEDGTVRLDTARSAQTRAQAPQGVADLSGISEEDLTQEEKDELAYGSGAVEDLGRYTGLAQRMGAPRIENQGGINYGRVSDGSSQRDAGERGRGVSGSLGGTAAGSEGGQVSAQRSNIGGADQAHGAVQKVADSADHSTKVALRLRNAAGLELTSGQAKGIDRTDDRASMAELTDDMTAADEELTRIKDFLESRGYEVHFFKGWIGTDHGTVARGAHDNGVLWIKVDDAKWTATQIALHEYMHGRIWRSDRRLFSRLFAKLSEPRYAGRLNEISDRYQEALLLIKGSEEDRAFQMLEEMMCDLYAGMNEFVAESDDAKTLRADVWADVESFDAKDGQETRGPPEGESGTAFSDAEKNNGNEYGITQIDAKGVQRLGRKSVNNFSTVDIEISVAFAEKFWNELGIKSPFFRAWFGDWRAYDITPVAPVPVTPGKALKSGRAIIADANNRVISWNSDLFGETKNHQRSGGIATGVVGNIKELAEKAVLLDTEVSDPGRKKKKPGTAFMHSFYVLADDGAGVSLLKLYAEEVVLPNDNVVTIAYELKDIVKVATFAGGVPPVSGGLTEANMTTIKKVADLYDLVKTYDKDFTPAPKVNKDLLYDDGKPRPMYHLSDAGDIKAFQAGNSAGLIYLAYSVEAAKRGARGSKYIYEVYPRVHKFVNTKETAINWYDAEDSIRVAEWKRQGYDGVYVKDEAGVSVAVFNPNQIKSATDNIGTFDKEKNNIHFSEIDEDEARRQDAEQQQNMQAILQQLNDQVARLTDRLDGRAGEAAVAGPASKQGENQGAASKSYKEYMTPEAKARYAADPRFAKWKYKNLAYISAAAWDGVKIPYEVLAEIPELREAQTRAAIDRTSLEDRPGGADPEVDARREELMWRLLDDEHGSAVFEGSKIRKANGEEDFSGPVARERKAFIIIGRPAGGKSSVFANPLSNKHQARILDSDTVKPWLDGYDDGYGAGYVQDESAEIMENALKIAITRGENIIIPKIGGNSCIRMAEALKADGYSVELYYNDVAEGSSLMRAASRFAEKGRYLDLSYLTSIKDKPEKTFRGNANRVLFDYAEWRNNDVGFGEEPRLVWNSDQGPLGSEQRVNAGTDTRGGRSDAGVQEMGRGESQRTPATGGERSGRVDDIRFSLNDDPELERARQQAEYWKQLALKNSGVKDVDKLTRDLMRGYGSRASRSEMSGRMRELEAFLRGGGSEAEARATARQMAEDMLNKAAVPEDAADSEYHAAFRRYFRTNSISVPEEVKQGWPDGWGRFRKRYFGRLNLKNDGMDVTKIYREASQQWPDLLPSDEVVMRAQDQLETIAEVLDNLEPNMVNPYGSGPEFDAAVDSLAEDIISSLTRTEEAKAREDTRLQRTEAETEELRQELGIEPETSEEMTPADLMAARKKAEGAKRYLQKTQRRMGLNARESDLVDALVRGTLTEDQLPGDIDRQGVLAVYRAKQTYLDAMAPVDEYNRQRRERNFTLAEQLIENSDEWKDMKNGFAYARETARRIFYGLTKNTEEAQALIDTYVETIRKNEAAKNRMINEYNERIKKLGIDTKTRAGNKVSEAYAVQFVGEAEFMLGWLEQLPEGTTRDGLTYGEVKMLLDEFWRDNPNLDQDRVHAAVAEFRGIYDELFAMVNEARVLNGYAPIDYRKGYFPHFTSDQGDNIIQSLARGMGIGVEVTELPTSIAGTTHLFRPGIQWSGHMLRRTGSTTDYNVLEGWDRYIPAVANIIYHTEDIQKLRALETVIRRKYSDTTVQDEIDATRRSKDMTAEEINAKLDELFKRDTTQLNYFVQWLREYTNQLAGKKAELDRNVEKFVGRKVYRIVQKLENRVAANMLGGNISSAMTNFVPLFQAWGNVSTASMMRAMWDTGVGAIRGNGWRDGSSFLVNRKGYDAMYQTLFGKVKNALFAPFNWVDDFVSETVVRARYYDELRRGLSPEAAMVEADAFAGGVMADRAIGELPTIFNSKNPLVKVFTMFQVEVNNDLSHLLKDIPKDARDKGLAALFTSVLKYMLGVYMFNDLFEWLFGRRVSIDPLSMLNDLAGDATGYELPNMFESAVLIAKGEWQGWEEFENGKGGDFFSDLVGDLKEWADDVPFISGLLGGGRFPIQAILPEEGAVKAGYAALRDILKPEEDQENPDAYDWNKIYKTVKNPLYYWAMPAFGGQLRKIAEGIYAYTQHGSYSQTKQGKVLQYPILGYDDLVKSMIFGKTTTRYGKEWIESDFDSLTAPQTEAYINLVSGGSDPELIYQILHDLKGTERTAAEKAYALASANLDDGERIMLFGALDRDKEAENFADLMGAGLTFRQCAEVLDEFAPLKAQAELTPDDDEGKAARRKLATQFVAWMDGQGFDKDTKDLILDKYDMGASPIRYDWLTAAGIRDDGALELALDWADLTPMAGSDKVTANQKITAVADAGYLTENEKHAAVRTLLSDEVRTDGGSRQTDYDKYVKGYDVSVEVFDQFLKVTTGVKGVDRDGDGKTDSGTKRDAMFAAINSLPLQPGQKTALALYQGDYSESSIRKNAPWLR